MSDYKTRLQEQQAVWKALSTAIEACGNFDMRVGVRVLDDDAGFRIAEAAIKALDEKRRPAPRLKDMGPGC